MAARYAIYYAPPPKSALWRLGSSVIGYDAETGSEPAFPPALPMLEAAWREATAEPRRYGFHATLKAPFGLRDDRRETDLLDAARAFAAETAPVPLLRLEVAELGAFVALVPAEAAPRLGVLADTCVTTFERFRAPLDAADLARRLKAPLTPRQVEQLERYGYPYVFADYRFHMTLTGPLPPQPRAAARAALVAMVAQVAPETAIAEIAVMRQDDRAGRFRVAQRFGLGRSVSSQPDPGVCDASP